MLGWVRRMFVRTDHPTDPDLDAKLEASRAERARIARQLEGAGVIGKMTHAERVIFGLSPDRRSTPRPPRSPNLHAHR